MNLTNLDTYSVEEILSFCREDDLCIFRNAFPEHEDALNIIWKRRSEVNGDKYLSTDANKLPRVIKQHRNLKKVSLKRQNIEQSFTKIASAIAGNCSKLEVLNIPGITLSNKHVRILCSCYTLKYLNISYNARTELVKQLLSNNPDLESISLNGVITRGIFESIPDTIKEIELITNISTDVSTFLDRVETWTLHKLSLDLQLISEDVLRLSTQTRLKYLDIVFRESENALELIFLNNPELEEVHLHGKAYVNGACLKNLPPTLKHLVLQRFYFEDYNNFIECVKGWNLQSLKFYKCANLYIYMKEVLKAAPSLTELHTDMIPWRNFDIKDYVLLKQIKILSITHLTENYNSLLKNILKNCVNLEKLTTTVLDLEIFSIIAKLPCLKEISLNQHSYSRLNFSTCMLNLCKSTSLRSVQFYSCHNLTGAAILKFIQGCESLTKLILTSCDTIKIRKNFLKTIGKILKTQTDRTKVLNLEIWKYFFYDDEPLTTPLHPMLTLQYFQQTF